MSPKLTNVVVGVAFLSVGAQNIIPNGQCGTEISKYGNPKQ
jgi:hypothetical protein